MPSFAKRYLADLPLQLLDALVDLRLVQPELQRCHRSGLLRRRGRRGNGAWFPASSVLLTPAADFLRRLVLLRRFGLPARRRWRAWAGQLGGHICHALLFSLPLRVHADDALAASLGSASGHSPRSGPSASEMEGVTTERKQLAAGTFWPRGGGEIRSTAQNIGGPAPITLAPSPDFSPSFYPTNRRKNRFRRVLPPPDLPLTPRQAGRQAPVECCELAGRLHSRRRQHA